ncbi:Transmembrane_domain-containing protein [Hexamita inflata]|uniref:Transmembrane domain-containing protein n=1 Tax=Hexamita inflata TaxID=28002 RepID=A0AA86TV34_9EUKA|nr:Transmembrane domain-containing protein [Hexamita inflata]
MQRLAPFADSLALFINSKINDFMQAISYSYALSLILSLVFSNILPCSGIKVKPLTYVIYCANFLAILARTTLSKNIFQSFNQMQILFTVVLSVACFVLTAIQMITAPLWPDIILGIVFMVLIILHSIFLWQLFRRLISM